MGNLRKHVGRVLSAAVASSLFAAALCAQSGSASISGQVTDPSGLAIPAVTVEITGPGGTKLVVQTDEQGRYAFRSLPPGAYTVRISLKGFTNFEKADVAVAAGKPQVVNAQLTVAMEKQEVTVQGDAAQVSVSAENNASSLVLKGKDLDALSDDPDQLQSDLEALAGPSAGPNGGQIYIDGFTGGQLPPKSAILEVRVNQNPFSAEYDKLGYGRIEITTKPGAAQYHGQFFVNGNDSAFNSRNPFAGTVPAYHSVFYDGNIGGPLGKKASFFFDGGRRNIQDASIVNTPALDDNYQIISFSTAVITPRTRTELSPRFDYQVSSNNVLTVRYQFEKNDQDNNGIGQFSLPTLAYNSSDNENSLQLSDTQVVSPRTAVQTRFRYRRETINQTPLSLDPTINVIGAFTGGGNNSGKSLDISDNYEFQNLVSINFGKHSLVFGGRLRDSQEPNTTTSGFNGSFTFTSIGAYQITEEGLNKGLNIGTVTCSAPCSPAQIRAAGGGASQFVLVNGIPTARVNLLDVGLYGQDDWRVRPNVTLSLGLRFESQTDIHDHADFAPRLGFAWGLGHGAAPKTVLRAGLGVFYDRFQQGQVLEAERLNVVNPLQSEYVVTNPTFQISQTSGLPCITLDCVLGAGATSSSLPTKYQIDPNLRAPYTVQSAVGLERQVTKNATLSVTYLNAHGVHQLLTRNINAPLPGTYISCPPDDTSCVPSPGVLPLPGQGNIYQYESDGLFNQNQVIANFNVRAGTKLSLFGFYTLNYAKSDAAGVNSFPMNQYDIVGDYGRASFDVRHRVFMGGSLTMPRGFRLSPFLVASSGAPFNITTGQQFNGDSIFNARPAFNTGFGPGSPITLAAFDPNPAPGQSLIPINDGTGPGMFSLNLRLAKTFGFGEKKGAGAGGGFGGGDRGGGRGPGGLAGRGLSGGGGMGNFFGGTPSNSRYNLEFSVNARNVFNVVNLGLPQGGLTSPLFDRSNSLAGGGFGAGQGANRRIDLQVRFSF
ncbi:MAG: carboxypeptidase regulatory-like domain-containing protein [Terriglobia bacterium]